jgi:hypothetical protein
VGSVKEGTIYKGKIGRPALEVFSPAGADGRTIATGMFFAGDRLVEAGRQTGLIFVYNTKSGRLISKLDNGLRTGQTFLNDTTFAPDGSASQREHALSGRPEVAGDRSVEHAGRNVEYA